MTKRQILCIIQFRPGPDLARVPSAAEGVAEFLYPLRYKDLPVTGEAAPHAPMGDLINEAMARVINHLDVGVVFATGDESCPEPNTDVLYPVIQTGQEPSVFTFPDLDFTVTLDESDEDEATVLESALLEWATIKDCELPPASPLHGRLGIPVTDATLRTKILANWEK